MASQTSSAGSSASQDLTKLIIHGNGKGECTSHPDRAIIDIKVTSETSSKQESLADVTKSSCELQELAKKLRVELEGSSAVASGGPLKAPLTDWNMGRLTTSTFIPHEVTQRLRGTQTQGLFGNAQSAQAKPSSTLGEPWTEVEVAEEEERHRRHTATTTLTMKFQDFSVLSSVASTVAVTPHAEVTNITWHLLDPTREALEKKMRKLAVRDAMEKANDFAEAATGSRTARMTFVETGSNDVNGGYGWSAFGAMSNQTAQAPGSLFGSAGGRVQEELSLEPGKLTVSWSVKAKFVADAA